MRVQVNSTPQMKKVTNNENEINLYKFSVLFILMYVSINLCFDEKKKYVYIIYLLFLLFCLCNNKIYIKKRKIKCVNHDMKITTHNS